jgi:hypothetical protein
MAAQLVWLSSGGRYETNLAAANASSFKPSVLRADEIVEEETN